MGYPTGRANRYRSKDEKMKYVKEVPGGKSSKEVGREERCGAKENGEKILHRHIGQEFMDIAECYARDLRFFLSGAAGFFCTS